VDALPDLATVSDDELETLLRGTEDEEEGISVRRRKLHDRIDVLRHERVVRLRTSVEAGTLDLPPPETLDRPIFDGTGDVPEDHPKESLPDLASLTDDELRAMIVALEREEDDISLRRRVLHGRIDILRAERERRRRGLHIDPADLGPILGGSPR
jgi:hypothetical protein